MKNLLKTSARIFAALALSIAVSACSPAGSIGNASFPSYNGQAAVSGQFSAPSIMDSIVDY